MSDQPRQRTQAACNASVTDELHIMPISERIDWGTTFRLELWAKEHLESLSPERRAELDRDHD